MEGSSFSELSSAGGCNPVTSLLVATSERSPTGSRGAPFIVGAEKRTLNQTRANIDLRSPERRGGRTLHGAAVVTQPCRRRLFGRAVNKESKGSLRSLLTALRKLSSSCSIEILRAFGPEPPRWIDLTTQAGIGALCKCLPRIRYGLITY